MGSCRSTRAAEHNESEAVMKARARAETRARFWQRKECAMAGRRVFLPSSLSLSRVCVCVCVCCHVVEHVLLPLRAARQLTNAPEGIPIKARAAAYPGRGQGEG